jgi:hypothetical protein
MNGVKQKRDEPTTAANITREKLSPARRVWRADLAVFAGGRFPAMLCSRCGRG